MEILVAESKKSFKHKALQYLLLILSVAGLVLTITEVYLNYKGSSLCRSEGCLVVHLFDVHNVLNFLGILVFAFVFLISILDLFNILTSRVLLLRSIVLSVCIIVEGFLFGFQIWFVKEVCHFCLSVFLLLLGCFLLDYFYQKNKFLFLGAVLGFIGVYFATFLVHVNLKPLSLDKPVLIYQKGCPHCRRVINFAKENHIELNLYSVTRTLALLRSLGINTVPDLIYKEKGNFCILNGDKAIIDWLEKKYLKKKPQKREKSKGIAKEEKAKRGVNLFLVPGDNSLLPEIKPQACELNHSCNQ